MKIIVLRSGTVKAAIFHYCSSDSITWDKNNKNALFSLMTMVQLSADMINTLRDSP